MRKFEPLVSDARRCGRYSFASPPARYKLAPVARFSLRALVRRPLFTLVVVSTMALGIAGTTALFRVVNAALLRDLPYPDSGRLYKVSTMTADEAPNGRVTPRETREIYDTPEHATVEAAAIANETFVRRF